VPHVKTISNARAEFVSFPNGRKPPLLNETEERIVPEDLFRPSLEGAHHYAYIVEKIEATVERLAEQLGAGPFFLVENVPLENITSRGEPAEFVHHSAFGYCGGGPIELMEIVRLVPERIESRFAGARPGVHHVAWAVPPASVEDLRRELEDRGLPEYLSAQLGEIDVTFHDASASLGHDIEIHVDSQGLRDFFQMVREGAEGWDGSEPLRPAAT
jgi:Glyoxalase/Bleomycin resistance protein/Dioxygenase superfamily